MTSAILSQIEAQINQLSIDEQLWLVGRIAQRIREHVLQHNVFVYGELVDLCFYLRQLMT